MNITCAPNQPGKPSIGFNKEVGFIIRHGEHHHAHPVSPLDLGKLIECWNDDMLSEYEKHGINPIVETDFETCPGYVGAIEAAQAANRAPSQPEVSTLRDLLAGARPRRNPLAGLFPLIALAAITEGFKSHDPKGKSLKERNDEREFFGSVFPGLAAVLPPGVSVPDWAMKAAQEVHGAEAPFAETEAPQPAPGARVGETYKSRIRRLGDWLLENAADSVREGDPVDVAIELIANLKRENAELKGKVHAEDSRKMRHHGLRGPIVEISGRVPMPMKADLSNLIEDALRFGVYSNRITPEMRDRLLKAGVMVSVHS